MSKEQPPADLQAAIKLQLGGHFVEADALYDRHLAVHPRDVRALCLRGVLAQQLGLPDAALGFLQKALAFEPDNPVVMLTLANVYAKSRKSDVALQLYERLLFLQPSNARALFEYAQVLQQRRSFQEAITCYLKLIVIEPGFFQAYNDLGAAWIACGEWTQAENCINRALVLNPEYPEAHTNRGVIYQNSNRHEEAIASYHDALQYRPDYIGALLGLGAIYSLQMNYVAAEQFYRQALAVDPEQVESHQKLGVLLHKLGRPDEALWHRKRSYEIEHIFQDHTKNPVRTVCVLLCTDAGNVPVDDLLPLSRYSRVSYVMEYVTDADLLVLPAFDLVFNAIGDRDYCDGTDEAVQRFLRNTAKPVMNRPETIRKTGRDNIPRLLSEIPDVVCAPTLRQPLSSFKKVLLDSTDLTFPVIIRPAGSHGGKHLEKVESAQDLLGVTLVKASHYYASNFINYRSADGYFRKYRMIFIDRRPYPYHLAIGKHWIVHYVTAEMDGCEWKLQEELNFLRNPQAVLGHAAMAAIERIGSEMDLDYCGIDFSMLSDGQVLVFETNATMLTHDEPASSQLESKNQYIHRIFQALHRHIDATSAKARSDQAG